MLVRAFLKVTMAACWVRAKAAHEVKEAQSKGYAS
jgi:hypothetical protein